MHIRIDTPFLGKRLIPSTNETKHRIHTNDVCMHHPVQVYP
jgi:hypothetical protein